MNNSEKIPVAIPVTVSAPPFEGDGTWIWIDNEDNEDNNESEKLNKNNTVIEENNKISWLKNKINKIIPNQTKNINKVFKVAQKTYTIVEKKPEVALVIIGASVGVVYVAGKVITNGAIYMIIPKITLNINKR